GDEEKSTCALVLRCALGRGVWDSFSKVVLSGGCPSTFLNLSAAEEDLTSKKGHVGEIGNNFPRGKDSEVGVTCICRLSVPVKESIHMRCGIRMHCNGQALETRSKQDRPCLATVLLLITEPS
ncbi:mCG146264, partial [Mus musculus]